jgi:hypothetical protein
MLKGWEFTIGWRERQIKDFSYYANFILVIQRVC